MTTVIDKPGLYDDIPEADYHGDPVPAGSLSSTGARKLLPPHSPAEFRHEQLHGQAPKAAFDFGHAAHREVLGRGQDVVYVDAADWRTKDARDERDAAYAAGKVPLLAADRAVVEGMAAALRRHPTAARLLDPERGGKPEQSGFWHDTRHDVWRRFRLDWLRQLEPNGRLLIPDYKTCTSAAPAQIAKAAANHAYHQQGAWYEDGVSALGVSDDPVFLFVFQEKTPPYLVSVVQLSGDDRRRGRARNEKALRIYRECRDTGLWPGYGDDVHLIDLPAWQQITDDELVA